MRLRLEVMMMGWMLMICSACSQQDASGQIIQRHWDYPREWHRIDVPVTEDNSVTMDFGGPILHVPIVLFSDDFPLNYGKPVKQGDFSFVYWYPSLTPGLRNLLGGGSPPPNLPPEWRRAMATSGLTMPLRVWVESLTYSDDAAPLRLPRPSENLSELTAFQGDPPKITDTPYPGLRRISWEESDLKKHPERAQSYRGERNEGMYIQTADSPYELYLTYSRKCYFKLYNPKTHFQAEGYINLLTDVDGTQGPDPGELTPAVASRIMQALNKMLENWASVPRKTSAISHQPMH